MLYRVLHVIEGLNMFTLLFWFGQYNNSLLKKQVINVQYTMLSLIDDNDYLKWNVFFSSCLLDLNLSCKYYVE